MKKAAHPKKESLASDASGELDHPDDGSELLQDIQDARDKAEAMHLRTQQLAPLPPSSAALAKARSEATMNCSHAASQRRSQKAQRSSQGRRAQSAMSKQRTSEGRQSDASSGAMLASSLREYKLMQSHKSNQSTPVPCDAEASRSSSKSRENETVRHRDASSDCEQPALIRATTQRPAPRPGAFRHAGIDHSSSESDVDDDELHSSHDPPTALTSDQTESNLTKAHLIDDTETIFEARDVQLDDTRRKNVILFVSGLAVIALIIAVTLIVMYALPGTNGSDRDDTQDPRCVGPAEELPIPILCLCYESTQATWDALDEDQLEIYDGLLERLQNEDIIDPAIVLNATGCQPEHQALLGTTIGLSVRETTATRESIPYGSVGKWYALLYFFVVMGGVDWKANEGWFVEGRNVCSWDGITCIFLDTIQKLTLPSNDLRGTLPSIIQYMTDLRQLDLSDNKDIAGAIPAEIGNMTALAALSFSGNGLAGPIPSEIGLLTRLDTLALSSNNLSGNIPSQLFQMETLETLQLSRNQLTGLIPIPAHSTPRNTRLTTLELNHNRLTGFIPSSIAHLTSLEIFNIAVNQLNQTPPTSMELPVRLEFVNVYQSGLRALTVGTMCDPEVPHPPQRVIAVDCLRYGNSDDDIRELCPCCTLNGDNETAMVRIICAEDLADFGEV